MNPQETQKRLERQVHDTETAWKAWLVELFGADTDPRYIKTEELLDKKLDAADALAGHLVDRMLTE